jgi:glucan phosphoethanolaminetransferase (alkaline phosphatase superfamily)
MGYSKEWDEYRKRRNYHLLSVVLFFLFFAFTFSVDIKPKDIFEHPVMLTLQFIVIIVVIVFFFRYYNWKCPRCNKKYAGPWYSRKFYSNQCRHCGLSKWATGDFDGEHQF